MSNGVTELTIGTFVIVSSHPIEPEDLIGVPCSLTALRAVLAKQVEAGRDLGRLQLLLDVWNANPGILLNDAIARLPEPEPD